MGARRGAPCTRTSRSTARGFRSGSGSGGSKRATLKAIDGFVDHGWWIAPSHDTEGWPANPQLMIYVHPIVNVTIFSGLDDNHGKILSIAIPRFASTGDFYIMAQHLGTPKWRYRVNMANIMKPVFQQFSDQRPAFYEMTSAWNWWENLDAEERANHLRIT